MSLIDRLENTKLNSKDDESVEFLKNTEIGGIVNRGLAELYRIQPKNPITFLANWLMNESRSAEISNKLKEGERIKTELKSRYEHERKQKEEEHRLLEIENEKEKSKKHVFHQFIQESKDIDENLNTICEHLKHLVNATGVYVSVLDKQRKITVTEEEDESAHLLNENVIRYTKWCSDHHFLKNKFIPEGQGITYDLYKPKEEVPEDQGENKINQENIENLETPQIGLIKKEEINHILIEEVVRNPKIKYFREPRLGCYLTIDMAYNSCLLPNSLLSACMKLEEFDQKIIAQNERKAEHDLRLEQLEKEKEKSANDSSHNNDNNPADNWDPDNPDLQGFNEEKIIIEDFETEQKKIIVSVDTLGQDRIFTDEEKSFIFETVKLIKHSWETLERNLLLKDRDIKLQIDAIDKNLKNYYTDEKISKEEYKHVDDYFGQEHFIENPIKDQKEKEIIGEYEKSRCIINYFFEESNINQNFLLFSQLEFVEYERVFQNVFYFAGVSNDLINEENTNKLDWKKARHLWNVDILHKIKSYNPFGSKLDKVSTFQMGNRLTNILEVMNGNDYKANLFTYSFVLSRLHDFLLQIVKVRKEDIYRRRAVVDAFAAKRLDTQAEIDDYYNTRAATLEREKGDPQMNENGDPIEIIEEDWIKTYDDARLAEGKNPPELPDEVLYDVDEDFILDQ